MIEITIACVGADLTQYHSKLSLPMGASLYDALLATDWLQQDDFAQFWQWCADNRTHEPNHKAWFVGIFSQKKRLDTVLQTGDRVEIYRPLTLEPMAKRKVLSKKLK